MTLLEYRAAYLASGSDALHSVFVSPLRGRSKGGAVTSEGNVE